MFSKFLIEIVFLLSVIQLAGCQSTNKKDLALKKWILNNQYELIIDSDSILQRFKKERTFKKERAFETNWISFGTVTTMYADNSLGQLAKIAGDSNKCIVTFIEFYNDPNRKRRIMIAAVDSNCLAKLQLVKLNLDSTSDFIFGKLTKTLEN
jgi:hypothetical protein